MMITKYKEYRPTAYDNHYHIEGREDWLLIPVGRNRDSDCLEESNFSAAEELLGWESDTVEIHRFGHWACGWFEIILADPSRIADVQAIAEKLDSYPILNEEDFSERETEAAHQVWKECYSAEDRIKYIRENPTQFEFRSMLDMITCVKGKYFAGYPGEILN